MADQLTFFVACAVMGAFAAGVYGERWRAKSARARWRARQPKLTETQRRWREARGASATHDQTTDERRAPEAVSATDQLRLVMDANFTKRPLLSKSEARVFHAAEKALRDQQLAWRVMAQVSLGEILSSPDPKAYSAVNSKRVDLLLVSGVGDPIAAIEYQGAGHFQGTAPARDAVKKEALRKAGIGYIEMAKGHYPADLAREISRLAAHGPH
ncbi:DUF2726 domain-containing protein [Caulobacter sp. 17J65-9]|uniref:DUF2726 domain-containing protein n=1 Tax=Caulobacter sp. 17J65-9 TaxID=2709382 RepID=UPI0013C8CCE3|nr:DUF2726 domain-containing protein [Caulobacter sp. 17J65-9]NEX93070.1 DUF2726 domain-containing protein [Caulobacter sp. 17J65-9]